MEGTHTKGNLHGSVGYLLSFRKKVLATKIWIKQLQLAWKQSRGLYVLVFSLFLDVISFSVAIPTIPLFVLKLVEIEQYGSLTVQEAVARAALIQGMVASWDGLLKFICQPLLGRISDTLGRKKMLVISQCGSLTCFALYVTYPSVATLFVSYTLHGLTQCTFTMGLCMVADNTRNKRSLESSVMKIEGNSTAKPATKLAKNFALVNAAVGAGLVVGAFVGGNLGRLWQRDNHMVDGPHEETLDEMHHLLAVYQRVFATSCTLFAFAILFTVLFVEETLPSSKRVPWGDRGGGSETSTDENSKSCTSAWSGFSLFVQNKFLFRIAVCYFATAMMLGLYGIWPLYARHRFAWGAMDFGMLLGVNGIALAVSQTVIVRILVPNIVGSRGGIVLGLCANAVIAFGTGLASSGFSMLVVVGVFALFGGVCDPLLKAIIIDEVEPSRQGAVQGAMSALFVLGQSSSTMLYVSCFRWSIGKQWLERYPPECVFHNQDAHAVHSSSEGRVCLGGGIPGVVFYLHAFVLLGAACLAFMAFTHRSATSSSRVVAHDQVV